VQLEGAGDVHGAGVEGRDLTVSADDGDSGNRQEQLQRLVGVQWHLSHGSLTAYNVQPGERAPEAHAIGALGVWLAAEVKLKRLRLYSARVLGGIGRAE
jgi:hypothetical protein